MIRLACFLGLLALVVLVALALHLDGATAIAFSFIGVPALGLSLLLHLILPWRARTSRSTRPSGIRLS